jgi:hypothetical protein
MSDAKSTDRPAEDQADNLHWIVKTPTEVKVSTKTPRPNLKARKPRHVEHKRGRAFPFADPKTAAACCNNGRSDGRGRIKADCPICKAKRALSINSGRNGGTVVHCAKRCKSAVLLAWFRERGYSLDPKLPPERIKPPRPAVDSIERALSLASPTAARVYGVLVAKPDGPATHAWLKTFTANNQTTLQRALREMDYLGLTQRTLGKPRWDWVDGRPAKVNPPTVYRMAREALFHQLPEGDKAVREGLRAARRNTNPVSVNTRVFGSLESESESYVLGEVGIGAGAAVTMAEAGVGLVRRGRSGEGVERLRKYAEDCRARVGKAGGELRFGEGAVSMLRAAKRELDDEGIAVRIEYTSGRGGRRLVSSVTLVDVLVKGPFPDPPEPPARILAAIADLDRQASERDAERLAVMGEPATHDDFERQQADEWMAAAHECSPMHMSKADVSVVLALVAHARARGKAEAEQEAMVKATQRLAGREAELARFVADEKARFAAERDQLADIVAARSEQVAREQAELVALLERIGRVAERNGEQADRLARAEAELRRRPADFVLQWKWS